MSMKEKKKVYAKPTITVAEWDFNEAVCHTVYQCSDCIRVVESGSKRVRLNVWGGEVEWKSPDDIINNK